MSIPQNLTSIQDRIHSAARRTNRTRDEITLIGVTKTVAPQQIREAYNGGLRVFGENRVQEFAGKMEALRDLRDAEWHMIGHLQSNKAAKAAELFSSVDSVDSLRLAEKLNAAAEKLGKELSVLIEINVGAEAAKNGLAPDSSGLNEILAAAPSLTSLRIQGL